MINFLLQDIPESVNDGLWITGQTEEFNTRGTNTEIQKYTNSQIHKYTNTQIQIHKHKYTGQTEEFNTRGTKGKRSLDRLYVVVVTADRRQQTSETLGCCKMKSKTIK